jgi:hypothetical protein
MRSLNFLLVPIVFLAASSAFAAEPSGDPPAAPPVVVLRGSSAPPTPWYTPPPAPSDVDLGDEPYALPYDGLPYDGLPDSFAPYTHFHRPYARFVRPRRVLRHPVLPNHRPGAAHFLRR